MQRLNQNYSLDTYHEQNNPDAETFSKQVNNVFTRTEFNISSETEISPNPKF